MLNSARELASQVAFGDNLPLGLYIHLPWCIRKCPYCDFNSHEGSDRLPFEDYISALLADFEAELKHFNGRPITSIFIGGGTPSLFPADLIGQLLDGLRRLGDIDAQIEITLEANPGAADAARFESFLGVGINRLSIGVQSFRDHQLRVLGRIHDAAAAHDAFKAGRAAGCENINIDLMHGLPDDQLNDCLGDLNTAIELQPEHISWYQLTIEPGTVFARKPPRLPEHDEIADQFDGGRRLLEAAGYEQYEISAYAKAGRRSKHNLNYWRFGDYLGIGAGAHGKLTTAAGIFRTEKRRSPAAFMSLAGSPRCTTRIGPLSDSQLVAEFAINALRLRDGYGESLFTERTGLPLSMTREPLTQAVRRGWLTQSKGLIRPTELGYQFLTDLQLLFIV